MLHYTLRVVMGLLVMSGPTAAQTMVDSLQTNRFICSNTTTLSELANAYTPSGVHVVPAGCWEEHNPHAFNPHPYTKTMLVRDGTALVIYRLVQMKATGGYAHLFVRLVVRARDT